MALCVAAYGFLSPNGVLIPPLRRQNPAHPGASPIRGLSTPRIRQSEPNATSKRHSQPCASNWRATSRDPRRGALVANEPIYDTVRLVARFNDFERI